MICSICNKEILDRRKFVFKRNMCKLCAGKLLYYDKYKDNPDYKKERKQYGKQYREEHKNDPVFLEKTRNANRTWEKNNKNKVNERAKRYRDTHKNDEFYRFKKGIRTCITRSFSRNKNYFFKDKSSEELLGCSIDYFISYITSLFKPGMTLDNYGEWELDHIVPISSASSKEEIEKLNKYTNFQPLWKHDNRIKSDKIIF